jgi:predicted amidohydrolase YtcJ
MIMTVDTVYLNGNLITLDPHVPAGSAVAIRAGRFVAVGADADVHALAGPDTEVVDLAGATVVPGFNDSHCHIEFAGQDGMVVDLSGVRTVAEALAAIREFVAGRAAGEWVTGSGWHPPAQLVEARYLTRADLDDAAPHNPVFLPTVGHVAMTNSSGLERAGIDDSTPNPSGGTIDRDTARRATGVLYENAIDLVTAVKPGWTIEELERQFAAGLARANSFGITSVLQPWLDPRGIQALQRLWLDRRLTARVGVMWKPDPSVSLDEWRRTIEASGVSSWFGNEWLKLVGIKIFLDGGMTLRTALMHDEYPGDGHDHGMATMSPEHLTGLVVTAHELGWRLGVHCVGDRAVDQVLDAFEAANRVQPIADRRFALIHGSLARREQLERARALGVRLELQPAFLWGKAATIEKALGIATASRAIPMRSALDVLGIDSVSMGTDFPVNDLNPFLGLQLAITRKDLRGVAYGPDETVTREEALRSYTASGAFATRDETVKGTITPGKLADFAVLSADYSRIAEEHIKDIDVIRTVVGGRVVFEK